MTFAYLYRASLHRWCESLNIAVAPGKAKGPTTKLTFLEIQTDTISMTLIYQGVGVRELLSVIGCFRPVGSTFKPVWPWVLQLGVAKYCKISIFKSTMKIICNNMEQIFI